jgi:hypothetical protein
MIVSQRVNSFSLRADAMKNLSSALLYLAECYVNIVTKYVTIETKVENLNPQDAVR